MSLMRIYQKLKPYERMISSPSKRVCGSLHSLKCLLAVLIERNAIRLWIIGAIVSEALRIPTNRYMTFRLSRIDL